MYEMCKIWKDCGSEVTVITSPYDKSDIQSKKFVSRMNVEGINLIVINAGDSNKFGLLKRAFRATIFALLSSYYSIALSADVLIASSGPITIGIPGILGKIFSRKKLVFEVRDLWPGGAVEMGIIRNSILQKVFFWFERTCYKNSSLVVPCSIGMENNIIARYSDTNCLVIPNGCDIQLFQDSHNDTYKFPNWLNNSSKLFVYTGSLGLMDACDEIILGFAQIENKDNIHIVFIGDGTERVALEDLTKKYNLEDSVHFIGLIPKTEVANWYKRATASFVVFKDFEVLSTSSPNKMFDSFAAGVPIIQNTRGWIKELVDKENVGINVNPRDSKSMANAIAILINEKMELNEMKKKALNCAKNMFERKKLACEYFEGMNKLL